MHTLRRISGEISRSYPRRHLVFILYICAYLLSAWLACALQLSRVCIHTTRDDGGGSGRGGGGETGVVYLTQSARRTYTYCMCVCVYLCVYEIILDHVYIYIHQSASIARASSSGRLERRIKRIWLSSALLPVESSSYLQKSARI